MKKQVPNWLFALLVAAVTVSALWIVGKTAPNTTAAGAEKLAESQSSPAPDFSGKTLDGKDFKLSDYKGKVVLVNFWATWCGPCRMEIPDLIRLQEKFGSKGFTVVGLSEDDSIDPVKQFVADQKINYPILQATSDIAGAYQVHGLPSSFLVNKEGKIIWAMEGVNPDMTPEVILTPKIEAALE